jgi:hypothetical protein
MRRLITSLCALIALGAMAANSAQQDPKSLQLFTNQDYVEDMTRTTNLEIDDPIAVFARVLDGLPERVTVYPTENHYYFAFFSMAYATRATLKSMRLFVRKGSCLSSITKIGPPG